MSGSDTDLIRCGWRCYDPATGRFLTRDPIGYAGGLNLYEFAGDNPVSFADPSGTNPLLCGAVGAGIGAIASGAVAYVHHHDVWQGVVRGAVVGGVSGFFTCLGAPELGAGFLGGFVSGAVGGAIGDSYGQLTAIAFGWQDCFNWPEVLSSAALGGATEGLTNVLGGAGGAVPENGGCFTAGTPVVMADGSSKPVQQVKRGDLILSKDPVTGKVAPKRVLRTFVRQVNETLTLTFASGERVETTGNHPFAVDGKGFLAAGKLRVGSHVVTEAGRAVALMKVEKIPEPTLVYNLEVDGWHSYFVGAGGGALWVHNVECIPDLLPFDRAARAAREDLRSVRVATRGEAERIARAFAGYKNTTGLTRGQAELFTRLYGNPGYYFWAEEVEVRGGVPRIFGHEADDPHGLYAHLQIRTFGKRTVRVFYGSPVR